MRNVLLRVILPVALCLGLVLPAQAKELLYLNGLGATYVVDTETLKTVQILKTKGFAQGFATSADKSRLYLTTAQRSLIEVFDRQTGNHLKTLSFSKPGTLRSQIYAILVVGDRLYAYLMSASYGGLEAGKRDRITPLDPEVVALDLKTEKIVGRVKMPYGIQALRSVRGGSAIYALGRDIYAIDPTSWSVRMAYELTDPAMENDAGPLSLLAYWIHCEASGISSYPYYGADPLTKRTTTGLLTLDEATGTIDHFEFGPPIANNFGFAAAVSPDKKVCYVSMNKFFEIDLERHRLKRLRDFHSTFYCVNVTSDGKQIFLSSSGSTLIEVDPITLEARRTVSMPTEVWDINLLPAEGGPTMAANGQPTVHIAPAAMPE